MVKDIIHHKPRYIRRQLDDVGDGSGIKEFVGNYTAVNPYEARIVAPPGRVYQISSMIVHINVILTGILSSNSYGANGIGLFGQTGIGISASAKDNLGVYQEFVNLGGSTAQTRVFFFWDYAQLGATLEDDIGMRFASPQPFPGMFARFDFVKMFGAPIVLRGKDEGKFAISLGGNNFSAGSSNLTYHRFFVAGLDCSEDYT